MRTLSSNLVVMSVSWWLVLGVVCCSMVASLNLPVFRPSSMSAMQWWGATCVGTMFTLLRRKVSWSSSSELKTSMFVCLLANFHVRLLARRRSAHAELVASILMGFRCIGHRSPGRSIRCPPPPAQAGWHTKTHFAIGGELDEC